MREFRATGAYWSGPFGSIGCGPDPEILAATGNEGPTCTDHGAGRAMLVDAAVGRVLLTSDTMTCSAAAIRWA